MLQYDEAASSDVALNEGRPYLLTSSENALNGEGLYLWET